MMLRTSIVALVFAGLEVAASAQCETEDVLFPGLAVDDRTGSSVAIRDRLAVVGSEQVQVSKDGEMGYVRIYRRTPLGWGLVQTLSPTGFKFGASVDTDGKRIIVGVPGFLSSQAVVYVHDGFSFVPEQTLTNFNILFGQSVAIRRDWAVVGGPVQFGPSHVFVYRLVGGTWVPNATFTSPAGQRLGQGLALGRGILLVGNPDDGPGRVDVYRLVDNSWEPVQALQPSDPDVCNFGWSVAIDRGVIAVGAACGDSVFFFEKVGGTWTETDRVVLPVPFAPASATANVFAGVNVDLTGGTAAAGVPSPTSLRRGRAYQLRRTFSGWKVEKELCPSVPLEESSSFGRSLAMSDDILVGHKFYDDTGGAFLYGVTPATQFLPICNAGEYLAGTATLPFTLYGTGSFAPLGDIVDWQWTFSDGGFASGPTPTHVFATSGTHTVELTVTDALGGMSTCSTQVVMNDPSSCMIQGSTAQIGVPITFDSSTSGPTVNAWVWDFGDGAVGTGPMPTHTYLQGGTFTVSLTVFYSGGSMASCSQDVTVLPFGSCAIAPLSVVNVGEPASFDGTASMLAGMTVVDFLWDFGDGSTGSGPMPTHAYSAPGSYTVSLTVVYSGGAQVTCTSTQVVNTPPQCLAMPAAQTVSLGAPAVLGSTSIDPDGTIVSTDWDFGDGNTASGTLLAHVYAAAGTYLVTLTVADDGGASSTCTASVTVLR